MTRYCLDAWAVVAWLEGAEPARGRVELLLDDEPLMSWVNLGEVYYVTSRLAGRSEALEVIHRVRRRLTMDDASPERVLEAAEIKAGHAVSYADAFAVATALANEATLVTGDPEILGAGADWPVEDVR